MRVSADEKDPGFKAFERMQAEGKSVKVFADGVEQLHCIMVDTDSGLLRRNHLKDGQPYCTEGTNVIAEEFLVGGRHLKELKIVVEDRDRQHVTVYATNWKEVQH